VGHDCDITYYSKSRWLTLNLPLEMSSSEVKPFLPTDKNDQLYVSIKAIVAGTATLPLNFVVDANDNDPELAGKAIVVPAFSFLITHPERGQILFDLGLRTGSSLFN
jgi:hypothetical protein